MHKTILTFSFPVTLTFGLKFDVPVTCVRGHVCTKLEISTAFLLPENRMCGTDGLGATLNAAY